MDLPSTSPLAALAVLLIVVGMTLIRAAFAMTPTVRLPPPREIIVLDAESATSSPTDREL